MKVEPTVETNDSIKWKEWMKTDGPVHEQLAENRKHYRKEMKTTAGALPTGSAKACRLISDIECVNWSALPFEPTWTLEKVNSSSVYFTIQKWDCDKNRATMFRILFRSNHWMWKRGRNATSNDILGTKIVSVSFAWDNLSSVVFSHLTRFISGYDSVISFVAHDIQCTLKPRPLSVNEARFLLGSPPSSMPYQAFLFCWPLLLAKALSIPPCLGAPRPSKPRL